MIFSKKRSLPISDVEGMLNAGTPENIIMQKLKEDGFSDEDIGKCLEQARVKVGVVAQQEFQPEGQQPWQGAEQQPQPDAQPQEPAFQEYEQPLQPLQPLQAPQQSYAQDEFQVLMETAIDNLKVEMQQKLNEIESRVDRVNELEDKLQAIISSLEEIKGKYAVLIENSDKFSKYEDELGEVKGNVNSVLQILKTTLPPVIKTLQEIKDKPAVAKRSDIEHLL